MAVDLTIAICAHNAGRRLEPTLRALGKMSNPGGVAWELLLIDNASTDGTADVARKLAAELSLRLRIILEPKKGKTCAMRAAVREATGGILTLLDDDNSVDENWIEASLSFFNEHPRAGIIGPLIYPIFEDPSSIPSDFKERFAHSLALRDFGPEPMRLLPPENDGPPGAGLTGRTALLRAIFFDISLRLTGPKGKRRTCGEDSEMDLVAHRLGWELWYVPSMRLGHVLPPSRLTEEYLHKLIAGGSQSAPWLDYLRGQTRQRSRIYYAIRWAGLMSIAVKMSLMSMIRRDDSAKFRFWAELHRTWAWGNLWLALNYPFQEVESSIKSVAAKAGPPAQAHAEAASC